MTITKISTRTYAHNPSRRQVYITALHPATRFPFNKAWVAPEGMNDAAVRAWGQARMEETLRLITQRRQEAGVDADSPAAESASMITDGIFESPAPAQVTPAVGMAALQAPTVPSKPLPKIPEPAMTITPDGMIGQIEIMSGLQLRHVRGPNDPIGKIEFDVGDLGKLTVLCMYKAEADRAARDRALAAAQAEIAADRARFLDVSQFAATMPDLPVAPDAYVPISKQAPSAAARAKTLSAGQKAANTARIKRFSKGGKGPNAADRAQLVKLVKTLADYDQTSGFSAQEIAEALDGPWAGISDEATAAILDYLARSRVISRIGSGEDLRYQGAKNSPAALDALLG